MGVGEAYSLKKYELYKLGRGKQYTVTLKNTNILLGCDLGSETRKVERQPKKNCLVIAREGKGAFKSFWQISSANKLSMMAIENEA